MGDAAGELIEPCAGATGERIGVGGFWTENCPLSTVGECARSEVTSIEVESESPAAGAAIDASSFMRLQCSISAVPHLEGNRADQAFVNRSGRAGCTHGPVRRRRRLAERSRGAHRQTFDEVAG